MTVGSQQVALTVVILAAYLSTAGVIRRSRPTDAALLAAFASVVVVAGVASQAVWLASVAAGVAMCAWVTRGDHAWLVVLVSVTVEVAIAGLIPLAIIGWPALAIQLCLIALAAAAVVVAAARAPRLAAVRAMFVLADGAVAIILAAAVAVAIAGVLARPPTGEERRWLLAASGAAASSAILAAPIRRYTRTRSERLLQSCPPASGDELLTNLSTSIAHAVPVEDVLADVTQGLRGWLDVACAQVWLGAGGVYELVASTPPSRRRQVVLTATQERMFARAGAVDADWLGVWLPELDGQPPAMVSAAAITHGAEPLGFIRVEHADGTPDTHRHLTELLPQLCRAVAPSLRNARLDSALADSVSELRRQADQLRASRQRVARAAIDARQALERDLHDGVQQHLIGIALGLRIVREQLAANLAGALTTLAALEDELEAAVGELRAVGHGIYPESLRDHGLAAALPAAARRLPRAVTVNVALLHRYPGEVEDAVYFCCLEALTNAAKHAGAEARIRVWVAEQSGAVVFEVTDDGAGFASPAATDGRGLQNLADRAGAIGGHVQIDSQPRHGTRVRGVIPFTATLAPSDGATRQETRGQPR